MIWAMISSHSCFSDCTELLHLWLKKYNQSILISVLTVWWCPCVVFSCVVGRGYLLWLVHSLGKTLVAFALLHSVLQGQIFLLLQVLLDFLLLHSSPLWLKGHFWGVLILEGLVGLQRTFNFSFFCIIGRGILSAALSHHLSGFEIAQLEFHHLH